MRLDVGLVGDVGEIVRGDFLSLAFGFNLFMLKAVLSGRGDEIVELARTNLGR